MTYGTLHPQQVKSIRFYIVYRYIENQQILEGSEATKAALRSIIRVLKAELKKRGIPVPSTATGIGADTMFADFEVDER